MTWPHVAFEETFGKSSGTASFAPVVPGEISVAEVILIPEFEAEKQLQNPKESSIRV
jgi:hypothetical protein